MKRAGLGSLLALLALASGCGGKAQTQDAEPSSNLPAVLPPYRAGGAPPRPASPPVSAPPQVPRQQMALPETGPSASMPRELMDPGPEAPALAAGVTDAGATVEPESPPVVSAVDAGQEQPPAIVAVDAGAEPPALVGAADAGADAG